MTTKQKQPAQKPQLPKCEYCGKPFVPTGSGQKYCKEAHRVAAFREKQKQEKE